MNTPRYAAAAARLLARTLPTTAAARGDRERGLATIERAMQVRARRRRMATLLATCAAAAVPLLGVAGAGFLGSPPGHAVAFQINGSPAGRGAALRTGEVSQPLAEDATLAAGQHIDTPNDGGAALQLSTGTSMVLAENTSFRVDSQGKLERFTLERGELSAHVAKLGVGQRFIVGTPDVEVEVRGTRFQLRVLAEGEACGFASRTRLEVTEGVVEVRAAGRVQRVRRGERWPADCSSTPQPAPRSSADFDESRPAIHEAHSAPLRRAGTEPHAVVLTAPAATASASAPHVSALARQNDLFAEGVAMRRQGDVSGALRAYDELIARYPDSPLAENALLERMRLLALQGDGRAGGEARRYLARYPRGFGAEEARRLLERR
jgi:ferric-dicitrate binding protein FerR (iron transport regulator)